MSDRQWVAARDRRARIDYEIAKRCRAGMLDDQDGHDGAFRDGVIWADVNPQPRAITQSEAEGLIFAIADKIPPGTRRAEEFASAILLTLHAAGIEVVDDE